MKKLLAAVFVSVLIGAVAALSLAPLSAQEGEPEPEARVAAVLDVSPITKQIAKLHAEVAAVRKAMGATDGMQGEVTKATAALKDVRAQVEELNDGFKTFAEAAQPVIEALRPATRWDYMVLRTRSESVLKRYGQQGWELVTASDDWLYLRKPLAAAKEGD